MKYVTCTLLLTLTFSYCRSQELQSFKVDTLWGFKDKQGNIKIEPQFQYAGRFANNIAFVVKNKKMGAINDNNEILIPFCYDFLKALDSSEFLFGYRHKYFGEYLLGVMTIDNRVKIPAEYSLISKKNETYIVTKNVDSIIGKGAIRDIRSIKGFYALFDINGKVLIPCKYNFLSWINDSLLVVESGTNQALFKKNGEQLTGFDYMVFGKFIEGVAKARIGDKYGFINPSGKVAIPINLEYCEDFNNGYALIKQGSKWGAINKRGNVVIKPTKDYQEVKNELKTNYSKSYDQLNYR